MRRYMKNKVELFALKIVSHLVFILNKEVNILVSKSGSTYISFDDKRIKVSDHHHKMKQGDIYIDVNIYTDPEFALRYLIRNNFI